MQKKLKKVQKEDPIMKLLRGGKISTKQKCQVGVVIVVEPEERYTTEDIVRGIVSLLDDSKRLDNYLLENATEVQEELDDRQKFRVYVDIRAEEE